MPPIIAQNLVIVLPRGMTLGHWNRVGLLEREWALYRSLAPSFGRLVVVTYGDRSDLDLAQRIDVEHPPGTRVQYIWNDQKLDEAEYWRALPAKVAGALPSPESSLIRTHQFSSGPVAVEIRDALRMAGHSAALLSRGGYLWSRFAAHARGPGSASARTASLAERALCRAAQVVVGTTDEMISDLCWRYMLEPQRSFVVPNFAFFGEGEPAPALARDRGLIVCSGHVSARKRVLTLVDALARLPMEHRSHAKLEVIGDGPELSSIAHAASRHGVSVECVGVLPHEQVLSRLSKCAIYAQASELEGHPKGVIDAMAAGAVVVVADSPGLGTIVKNGVTGIRVPGGDADGFANAFMGLLGDEDWREMLGSTAARQARTELGLARVVSLELAACRAAMELASSKSKAA
ncbi:MAG: glycosyltransferase [Planctomycetota bacterium]